MIPFENASYLGMMKVFNLLLIIFIDNLFNENEQPEMVDKWDKQITDFLNVLHHTSVGTQQ